MLDDRVFYVQQWVCVQITLVNPTAFYYRPKSDNQTEQLFVDYTDKKTVLGSNPRRDN